MSNEDLVSCEDMLARNCISPVSHEMTARELLHIELRMFGKYLEAWSEYTDYVTDGKVEEAVAIVERWTREHEERSEE